MIEKNDLTVGSIKKTLIVFTLPYLISNFLQMFYGLVDLYVIGLYNAPSSTTAVAVGSQVMHMFTVIILGLALGSTVGIGSAIGSKNYERAKKTVGTTIIFFATFTIFATAILLLTVNQIVNIMLTPKEAIYSTNNYLFVCFIGLPFIIAYNVISSIYRGAGDSFSPMIFVSIACVLNIALDFLFIGALKLGATGAALGTVISQAISVCIALFRLKKVGLSFRLNKKDIYLDIKILSSILKIGIPVSLQDGLIQVAFIVITIIANGRGLLVSSGVGITEKIISFMFLVPSAFSASLSAVTSQNIGAKKFERAKSSLMFCIKVTVEWGFICCLYCQFFSSTLVSLFTKSKEVTALGSMYLRSYSFDCVFAAIHFCFSGYFCGYKKAHISFIHNVLSCFVVRVPGAYFASIMFPKTLYPMGLAAPLGSLFSAIICVCFYVYYKREKTNLVT